ncbi:hypothetical protein ACIHEJ_39075 [Streptomyces sp. NPDC052301]|uniref:hypothetical protein n=1 Tax=Streptomyces sp. NPDC052301 TaxID=3365687 RepID=UPI0037CF85C5
MTRVTWWCHPRQMRPSAGETQVLFFTETEAREWATIPTTGSSALAAARCPLPAARCPLPAARCPLRGGVVAFGGG